MTKYLVLAGACVIASYIFAWALGSAAKAGDELFTDEHE
jgi:hypothetical protein